MTTEENHPPVTVAESDKNKPADPAVALQSSREKTPFLLSIVILLLAMSSGFLYYRFFLFSEAVNASLATYSQERKGAEQQLSELQNQLTALNTRLQQEEATVHRQAELIQDWQGLNQNGPSGQGRNHSLILDAQYFVKLANDQLLVNQEVPQALRLLEQAQIEINSINGDAVLPLKKALEQDLETLKTNSGLQLNTLYMSLNSLQQQVQRLPLLVVPVQNKEAAPSLENISEKSWWERSFTRITVALSQIVRVYHLKTPETPPFITPDQGPYLYNNLQARLNEAAWAVLHHQPEIYRANLQQALEWIQLYFSLSSPQTKAFIIELQRLQTASVEPAKEIVLLSPQAFETYLKAEANTTSSTDAQKGI